jgi:hypothetical protein
VREMVTRAASLLLLSVSLQACGDPPSYPPPDWVVRIQGSIDAEECGSQNCRACEEGSCSAYPESCRVERARYSCGPACDAMIAFCVDVGPAETGEATVCASDDDCWCRSFTGAQFIPGERAPNRCNMETNRCRPCYYE